MVQNLALECLPSTWYGHWPSFSANGEVEQQNRSLMKRIRFAVAEGENVKEEARKHLLA